MKIDTKNPNPGVWFSFGDAEVCIRLFPASERERVMSKCSKKKEYFKAGRKIVEEVINEELFSELLWDYCIINWKNITDQDGNEFPCSKENKIFIMKESPRFSNFIADCLEKLNEADITEKERIEKNF